MGFLIPPLLGFVICFALWVNLGRPAIIVGTIWMAAGIAFGIWKTRISATRCRLKCLLKSSRTKSPQAQEEF